MNSSKWKDVPYLFVGKFKFKTKREYIDDIRSFYDLREKTGNDKSIGFNNLTRLNEIESLIARPISDMSDEEIREITAISFKASDCEIVRRNFIESANADDLSFAIARKMIQKGVYPFSQSDFENDDLEVRYENQ